MFVVLLLSLFASAAGIAECPGESARYGDHKCNHDPTHRVCAQLLDGSGQPLNWGEGNFWEITGQTEWQWDEEIRLNHGDSWCICMWATARLISAAGCDNVHLDCSATDVSYVLQSYNDGGVDLEPAHQCLAQKCPGFAASRLYSKFAMPAYSTSANMAMAACALIGALASALVVARIRALSSRSEDSSADDELGEVESAVE
mmetsp:Transcript_98019/g.169845  ORF Transcript_98019/g.169845 Transcript_98019/m.169845 type:complete len:202 (+) Transcript_98019:62-667(+)